MASTQNLVSKATHAVAPSLPSAAAPVDFRVGPLGIGGFGTEERMWDQHPI